MDDEVSQQARDEATHHIKVKGDTKEEIAILAGRMNAMDMQMKAMQEGFNRLQAALQPTLSRQGACGAEPAS